MFGVAGLGDALDEGLEVEGREVDFVIEDLLFLAADDLVELAGFLFAALAGLTGVLNSACSLAVKLSSLIGETDDLLLAVVFLDD